MKFPIRDYVSFSILTVDDKLIERNGLARHQGIVSNLGMDEF